MGTGFHFPLVPDATPLSEEDKAALIPTHLVSMGQLNEWEQMNILVARRWALTNRRSELLTERYIRNLHSRMFDLTWSWAGINRHSDTSIGVPHYRITASVKELIDDATYWVTNKTFDVDEIAVRLHHRLVYVHPFPNGNGRHARLMADVFLRRRGVRELTWGSEKNLRTAGATRQAYIAALKRADQLEYGPLIAFARS